MPETKCGFDTLADGSVSGAELLIHYGPTLLVNIGFDEKWVFGVIPDLAIKDVHALVDTGATESCIDDLLATQLNLPVIDEIEISGAGGAHKAKVYMAQIYIPSLDKTIYGSFAGVHLAAGGQSHLALIGRTFLRGFTMIYEGDTGAVLLRTNDLPKPIL